MAYNDRMRRIAACIGAVCASVLCWAGSFSGEEQLQIIAYWNADDRYVVSCPPEALAKGPWQVRLTPEGSQWLWNYNKARGLGKVNPTIDAGAQTPEQVAYERWIDAKVSFDRYVAARVAAERNSEFLQREAPTEITPAPDPGPIPPGLLRLAGEAPAMAAAVQPLLHTVTFHDGMRLTFTDNPTMRPRYAYYRFPEGVMSGGTSVKKMPAGELDEMFRRAGITPSEQRIMKAVSLLEGGFDSVNTYDTGFVSVGFIQFACLSGGAGSLGQVMATQKRADPMSFDRDFRSFGIDVTPDGRLVAFDTASGIEYQGPEAAALIIKDKRLIAVFQRAGRISTPFRVAQLRVAKERYYPADDVVVVNVGGNSLRCRVGDIVRSEAGLATLMDRKVNTGKLDPFPAVLARCVAAYGLDSIYQAAGFEQDLVAAVKWRKDYLADTGLSQPRATVSIPVSRAGKRPETPPAKPKASVKAPAPPKKKG
jgi:hypothetical protein